MIATRPAPTQTADDTILSPSPPNRSASGLVPLPATASGLGLASFLVERLADYFRNESAQKTPLDPGTGGRSIEATALQIADVIVSTTAHASSRIIRAGTGSQVSHAGVYIGGDQVVEAIGEGVILRSLADSLAEDSVAVAFRYPGISPEQQLKVRDFVGTQLDKPYNYVGIVRQALFQVERTNCDALPGELRQVCQNWVGKVVLGPGNSDTFYCSELLLAAYANAGVPLTSDPPNWSTPQDIVGLELSAHLAYVGHLKAPVASSQALASERDYRQGLTDLRQKAADDQAPAYVANPEPTGDLVAKPKNGSGNGDRLGESGGDFVMSPQPQDRGAIGLIPLPAAAATLAAAAPVAPPAPPAPTAAQAPVAELPISLKEATYSDQPVETEDPATEAPATAGVPLTNHLIYQMVREVCLADSGEEAYSAVAADREFNTAGQAAYEKRHFGLAFGLCLFTQESGLLGRVLTLFRHRDGAAFNQAFGADADALLAVTNAASSDARLADVGGHPLWTPPWLDRFRQAGRIEACQNAQNEVAIEGLFRPMLNVAMPLGLDTDRGMAMAFDRVVTGGLGAGLAWVVHAAGPLRTETQRANALAALGYDSLQGFQETLDGARAAGGFTPATHAALVGGLRATGLVPLPESVALQAELVATATGPARTRLLRLRDSTRLSDVSFRQL